MNDIDAYIHVQHSGTNTVNTRNPLIKKIGHSTANVDTVIVYLTQTCNKHSITVYRIPPNTTVWLQPCHV